MTLTERYRHVLEWFEKVMPVAESELNYRNPYELLVAVILSAQCTDKRINLVTPALFERFPTPVHLAAAEVGEVFDYIRTVSYPNNKAKHLVGMAKMLVERFDSVVPDSLSELTQLPGVGRKTANVIMAVIFDLPAMPVDTHVFRVANRIGLVRAKTVLATEQQLVRHIDGALLPKAHHWLILHGRYICLARKPQCLRCGITEACRYFSTLVLFILSLLSFAESKAQGDNRATLYGELAHSATEGAMTGGVSVLYAHSATPWLDLHLGAQLHSRYKSALGAIKANVEFLIPTTRHQLRFHNTLLYRRFGKFQIDECSYTPMFRYTIRYFDFSLGNHFLFTSNQGVWRRDFFAPVLAIMGRIRPAESDWNVSLGFTNYDEFGYDGFAGGRFIVRGDCRLDSRLCLFSDATLRMVGDYNFLGTYNELITRIGMTYRW